MDELQIIARQEREFDELMRDIDLGQAYINATQEHGPSQQLMLFINRNGDYGKSIGLESFETFSLQTQHEIMLSKLNLTELDYLAVESLVGRIHTIGKWLQGGGALAAFFVSGAIGGLGIPAIIAGTIIRIVNTKVNGVIKYSDFGRFQTAFDRYVREELLIANQIPSSDNTEAWNRYLKIQLAEQAKNTITTLINTFTPINVASQNNHADVIDAKHYADRSGSNVDGWDERAFSSSVKWLSDTAKKIQELETGYSDKLKKLDQWVSSPDAEKDPSARQKFKIMSDALSLQFESFVEARRLLTWAEREIKRVAKLFKEEKK